MLIQVNTDRHIVGHTRLVEEVQATISAALDRFAPQVTRVEVHLTDENGEKKVGNDIRCVLEARLGGLNPSAVTHDAPSIPEAVDGALERLTSLLDSQLGKMRDKKGRPSYGDIPG